MWTASNCMGLPTCRIFSPTSSREQSAKVRPSVKPAAASSILNRSDSFIGNCWLPTVTDRGKVLAMLLNPYAIATSSTISQAWITSERVGGIVTLIESFSAFANSDLKMDMRYERLNLLKRLNQIWAFLVLYENRIYRKFAVDSKENCILKRIECWKFKIQFKPWQLNSLSINQGISSRAMIDYRGRG